MFVTPGIVIAANEPLTPAKLNAGFNPIVELEDADRASIAATVRADLGQGVAGVNYLRNADFSRWTRGNGPLSLSEGIWTELADYWLAKADYAALGSGGGGAFASYQLDTDSAHQQWLYNARLSGSLGLVGINLGQELPARIAAALHPKCTVTFEIENQTGAAIVAQVRLRTCNALENYGATTLRVDVPLPSIPNGETRVSTLTLDLTSYGAALNNGAQLYLHFPAMNDAAKYVRIFAAKVEIGETATARITERNPDAVSGGTAAVSASAGLNYFANPNLHRWRTETQSCAEDVPNFGPIGWFARPSDGAALVLARDTTTPDASSRFSAQLTGASDCTGTVDFGTRLDLPTASEARRQLILSIPVRNDTGLTIVPELHIDTCNAANGFTAVTSRIVQALAPCANAAWTTVTYAFDAATVTNFANGAVIYLRFDNGTLDNTGKIIRLARPRLEPGTEPTTFTPGPAYDEPATALGSRGVLKIACAGVTSGTPITVNASEVVLKDAGGNAILAPVVAASLLLASHGPNGLDYSGAVAPSTWHYISIISTGTSHAALLSRTPAPILPDGYPFAAIVGAVYIDGSSLAPAFIQHGKEVWFGPINTGTSGTDGVSNILGLSTWIPAHAVAVKGTVGNTGNFDLRVSLHPIVADTGGYSGPGAFVICQHATGAVGFGFRSAQPFNLPIIQPQTLYWVAAANATTIRIDVCGFTLP